MKKLLAILLFSMLMIPIMAQTVIMKDTRFLRDRMKKFVLITQVPDDSLRQRMEGSVMEAFEKKRIPVVNIFETLRQDTSYYYSSLEREFTNNGVDGIIIVKLIDIGISDMYIFPGGVLPPDAYNYYEFYSVYYYYDLPIIGVPDYLARTDRKFRIDINVYPNKGDMIVLSAQTGEIDPLDCDREIKALGKKLANILISNKLVERE